jgi:membrane-associated phospholipid phosphatase
MRVLVTAPALAIMLFLLTRFLLWVEGRSGVVLDDPVLRMFAPIDVNWITFAIIYGGVTAGVVFLSRYPERFVLAFQSYVIMVAFRIIAMTLVPLDPPATPFPLLDPFVETFGTGVQLTKDLFFSGHTATLFLLFLVMPTRITRGIALLCVLSVACGVLLQHVHYSIDVFAAAFFAYAANAVARGLNSRYFPILCHEQAL